MDYLVLVVDDDEDDLFLLANHLKHCYQQVRLTYAQNGEEATRQLIEGLQPHLIVVDAHMPLMDGYELVEWIMNSRAWRHIPTVVWTDDLPADEITRYYRAGANSVMLKQDALQAVETFCEHWFKLVQLPQLLSD